MTAKIPFEGDPSSLRLRPLALGELEEFSRYSHELWKAAYGAMGWPETVLNALWSHGYSLKSLKVSVAQGERLFWLEALGERVGILGERPRIEDSLLQLSKLYLVPSCWGLGLGRLALEGVKSRAIEAGFEAVELWVLRRNRRAIRAYRRAGFRVIAAEDFAVSQGIEFQDYRMRWATVTGQS